MTSTFNRIKAPASKVAEEAWRRLASIVGHAMTIRAERVQPALRVLVVAPHPDDETVGCGGTIALHRLMGDPVEVAVVTDGRRSASAGTTEEERIDARRREATRAMSILGIDELSWLSHEEWSWDLDRVVDDLRKIVGQRPPSVIYAPCRIDGHPEHVRVAHAVARAVNDGSEIMIRGFQIHTPLTPLLVNRAFDVSSVAETAARALAAYETQLASIARTRRLKRYSARLHGAESEAEVFWEMTSTDYRRAHAIVDEQEWRAYTGLGPNAFRDPAAYLIGLRARLKTRAGSSLR